MGINVVIQDENGTAVSDQIILESHWLPQLNDTHFVCLRFVDPYGDTTFNQVQIPFLLGDLRLLRQGLSDPIASETILRIESLVERFQNEAHYYVKMIGD